MWWDGVGFKLCSVLGGVVIDDLLFVVLQTVVVQTFDILSVYSAAFGELPSPMLGFWCRPPVRFLGVRSKHASATSGVAAAAGCGDIRRISGGRRVRGGRAI